MRMFLSDPAVSLRVFSETFRGKAQTNPAVSLSVVVVGVGWPPKGCLTFVQREDGGVRMLIPLLTDVQSVIIPA